MKSSTTDELISAGKLLARDLQSDDGVAQACVREMADRLEQFHRLACLARELQRNLRAPKRQERLADVLRQLAAFDVDLLGGDSKVGYEIQGE